MIGTDDKERENDVAPVDLKPLRLERPALLDRLIPLTRVPRPEARTP